MFFACIAEQVAARARSIMSGTLPSTSYASKMSWNPIPRRPKRSSKSDIAATKFKCGGASKKGKEIQTFQRKLVVFRYMGEDAPSKFTRKEHRILMRGMIDIPLDATEFEVREEILSVIHSNSELQLTDCVEYDFEFLDASGKNVSRPNVKPGSTFNCKTVKRLAGNGAVYIRMTKDCDTMVVISDEEKSKSPTPTPMDSPDECPSFQTPPRVSVFSQTPPNHDLPEAAQTPAASELLHYVSALSQTPAPKQAVLPQAAVF